MANPLTDPDILAEWKGNPLTQAFLGYLRDRQMALMEAWALGSMEAPEQQAQAVILGQLHRISSDDIADHYAAQKSEGIVPDE